MKKVVVIGAGLGGLASAALLKKEGIFDVTLVERNPFVGGKAASYEKDGFVCDMGVHYCSLGEKGPLKEVARRIGADVLFIEKKPFMRLHIGGRAFDFGASFLNPVSLIKMALITRAHPRSWFGGMRFFLKLLTIRGERDVVPYDETPLDEFLSRYISDEHLKTVIYTFAAMLMVLPPEEASAGEFLYCFGAMARSGSLSYPRGAFGGIAEAYRKVFEQNGGRILMKTPVASIRVENNRVVGVDLPDGFLEADIVVSNAGIQRTVDLTGEQQFSKSYVDRVRRLTPSTGAATLKYALHKAPIEIPLYMYCPEIDNFSERLDSIHRGIPPANPHMFMPITTASDPGLAPPGKHVLIAGSMVPAALSNRELAEKILDNMETTIATLFPGFERNVIWKHRTNLDYINGLSGRGAGEVIGIGQTWYQVGKNKPDARTPVKGLWLVGCDAGGRGVGTEQAAHSALNVSRMILDGEKTG